VDFPLIFTGDSQFLPAIGVIKKDCKFSSSTILGNTYLLKMMILWPTKAEEELLI
jgi:hypothetical protein